MGLPLREWDIWKEDSEEGVVCGMFGCTSQPNHPCPLCGNHYCGEHIKIHFHIKKGFRVFGGKK